MRYQSHSVISGRALRRGFSFVEVLFAVMILGIGFIMVAAIFPAALTQTKATNEEANAAALARGAVNLIERRANNSTMEATGNQVVAADFDAWRNGSLYDAIREEMIPPADQREAWIVLYKRAGTPIANPLAPNTADWEPYGQVFLFPVQARNEPTYILPPQLVRDGNGRAAVTATISDGAIDQITFSGGDLSSATPGAYVIVANATYSALNGRIFRLGNQINGNSYELAPGNDFIPEWIDVNGNPADGNEAKPTSFSAGVFIIGRGTTGNGAGQDVAAYTTFIQVK